jgi:hypothetical protein
MYTAARVTTKCAWQDPKLVKLTESTSYMYMSELICINIWSLCWDHFLVRHENNICLGIRSRYAITLIFDQKLVESLSYTITIIFARIYSWQIFFLKSFWPIFGRIIYIYIHIHYIFGGTRTQSHVCGTILDKYNILKMIVMTESKYGIQLNQFWCVQLNHYTYIHTCIHTLSW